MKHKFLSKKYWVEEENTLGGSGELAKGYDDVINLSIGDPDLNTNPKIIKNALEDALNGHTHYTAPGGYNELREEICKFYKEEYSYDLKVSECMVTTSGCHAMWLVLQTVIDEGDEVIVFEPYFTPYIKQIEMAGGKAVKVKLSEEDGFQINMERLRDAITDSTKAIIINTPNNPTGICLTKETLENLSEIAKQKDLLVIADDIYTAYTYEEPFLPITTIDGMKERTITVKSFSKDYCMTGWRVGYVLAPSFIIETMININENNVYSAPSVSQRAALYALRMRYEIQKYIVEEFRNRAFYTYERIQDTPKMSCIRPTGSIYLFVNIKETGLTSKEFTERLLKEAHVLVIPGNAFGESGEGYVRIALTVNVEKLKEAFDRIEKFMKKL